MMPTPISGEVWAVIGQWIVYGASLTGAIMGIAQFIKWMRSKTTVAKLEAKVNDHEIKLDRDYKAIKTLEQRAESTESDSEDTHKILQLLLASNNAILQSLINGNNTEGLKKVSSDIQEYLTKKV